MARLRGDMIACFNPATLPAPVPLDRLSSWCAQSGFAALDFKLKEAVTLDASRVRASWDELGLRAGACSLDVEWRRGELLFRAGLGRFARALQAAGTLGVTCATTYVLPGNGEPRAAYQRRSIARLAQVARLLDSFGLRLAIEWIGPHHLRPDASQLWFCDLPGALEAARAIEERAGTRNVGLLVDSFHWHTSGAGPKALQGLASECIAHVHLNDAPSGIPVSALRDDERELPGATGAIDTRAFLDALRGAGYAGPVAVEVFSPALRALSAEEVVARAGAAVIEVLHGAAPSK